MPSKYRPFSPADWIALGLQQQSLLTSAGETIARRTVLMGQGTMTPLEATSMMFEKPAAFAEAYHKAAVAAVKGKNPISVTTEFLKPITRATESNAKRLR